MNSSPSVSPPRQGEGSPPADSLAAHDWSSAVDRLLSEGCGRIPRLLSPQDCRDLVALYDQPSLFRSRVVMQQHGFGRGEYQYFRYPLPPTVGLLRARIYPRLAAVANTWSDQLGEATRYPLDFADFRDTCHLAGQSRPTPLLLRYGAGDYNRLHQDLYGPLVFPIQVTVLLSEPRTQFSGGEFVLTEQRPRMQSRVEVIPLEQGDAVVFAVNVRPVQGARSVYRARMRHGVSPVRSGQRFTLGIIFHDAA